MRRLNVNRNVDAIIADFEAMSEDMLSVDVLAEVMCVTKQVLSMARSEKLSPPFESKKQVVRYPRLALIEWLKEPDHVREKTAPKPPTKKPKKPRRVLTRAPERKPPVPMPTFKDDGNAPPSLNLSLEQLTMRTCKWAYGEPPEPITFCGHPKTPTSMFCAYHQRRAFPPRSGVKKNGRANHNPRSVEAPQRSN